MLYFICKSLAALACKTLFRVEVSGRGNIPKKGGFILASNHLSHLDPIVLAVVCPRKLSFMARDTLFRNPLFSWLISNVGAFPVKRASADLSAVKEAMKCLKNNRALLLFPQGTRALKPDIDMPVQSGVGFLAAKAGVPVIPAFIKGTDKAMPRDQRNIGFHKIRVCFGRQIVIDKDMPYESIAQQIMEYIRQLG